MFLLSGTTPYKQVKNTTFGEAPLTTHKLARSTAKAGRLCTTTALEALRRQESLKKSNENGPKPPA